MAKLVKPKSRQAKQGIANAIRNRGKFETGTPTKPISMQCIGQMMPLDKKARDMTKKWGDSLPELVSPDLAGRFEAAYDALRVKVEADDVVGVHAIVGQLMRAWDVLEAEALSNGHQPVGPHAYCIEIASGHIVCIALHDAMGIRREHPEWTVYDMVDAAVVLANNFSSEFIEKTLQSFPEAKVTRVIGTANDTFNVDLGDEIPF
jgi:hypothetical protein